MKGSIRRSVVVIGAALVLLGAVQTASASANVSGWQKVKGVSAIDSSPSKTARAYCPDGKRAIGGFRELLEADRAGRLEDLLAA